MSISSIALLTFIIPCTLSSSLSEHPLENECTYNDLESGAYRCFMPDEGVSFNVYCMVDGTMYINPTQQALYHYHKQNGLEMNYKLLLPAEYNTMDDVDEEAIPLLRDSDANTNDDEQDVSTGEDTDDALESEELTPSEKQSVNMTAQYIVYGVIIFMALVFAAGICILIYWWCCRDNNASDKANTFVEAEERQPFIDIRSQNTIQRKALMARIGNTLHFGRNERNNVYDDIINRSGDNEDGDDLIRHYGSTNSKTVSNNDDTNDGYVIAKHLKD